MGGLSSVMASGWLLTTEGLHGLLVWGFQNGVFFCDNIPYDYGNPKPGPNSMEPERL